MDGSAGPDELLASQSDGVLDAIRESVLLKIAIGGVVLALIGTLLDSGTLVPTGGLWSIWAALLAVWGAGLFLVGVGAYGFLWWRRN
jgi:hypothetical protein